MRELNFTSFNPSNRRSQRVLGNAGFVELTEGSGFTMLGPLSSQVFVLALEPVSYSLTFPASSPKSIDADPFAAILLPAGIERCCVASAGLCLLIVVNEKKERPTPPFSGEPMRCQDVVDLVQIFLRTIEKERTFSPQQLDAWLDLFEQQLVIHCDTKSRNLRSHLNESEWRDLLLIIDDSLEQSLSVRRLAELARLSISNCNRVFRLRLDCPPMEYVRERRLYRARRLLTNTEWSLTDIAYATGFCSQAHFTSRFSERFGSSPAKFRRTYEISPMALAVDEIS